MTAATSSMTGTGAARGASEVGPLRVELRSVNGRVLQVKQRLCREVAGLEAAFEDEVRQRLSRGSVVLVVDRDGGSNLPDRAQLAALAAELKSLSSALGLASELSLKDVLELAERSRPQADREAAPKVLGLVRAAIDDLHRHRIASGAETVLAMRVELDALDALRLQAVQRAPAIVEDYRARLVSRLQEFVSSQGLHLEPAALVREVGLFAERVDTGEELQRLDAHLRELRNVLQHGGAVGRKVEFLLQEVLRETNTLGSKSPDVATAHCVVAMKSAIDRLKEQAANLE